jgi:SAM-dependent methyltransferase
MTTQCGVGTGQLGTTTDDYTSCYYASHLGSEQEYSWDSPEWRAFFTNVANKVVTLIGAKRVLDVGCARGLMVQALAEAGVDAHGTDISETAIASAHPDVQGRLSVATAVDPIEGSWDLVSCIEVVEHMSPVDADRAITNMCAATEQVLFSSGPGDFAEPTHVNVRPPADWAASFAERGFFRRTDLDVSFLTPWAVLFERADLDARAVVHRYEAYAYPMRVEVLDKRAALLEAHRTISRQHDEPEAETAAPEAETAALEAEKAALEAEKAALQAQISELKHRLLTSRDHAIGAEATAARAVIDLAKVNAQKVSLEQEIQDMKGSERWRVGGWAAAPASFVKHVMKG